jgi:hypothetical protein
LTLALILTFSPRRRNSCTAFLVMRMTVRQIQSREFSKRRRTILLLLGEKAGMREVVKPIADLSRRNRMKADGAMVWSAMA